MKEFEVLVAVDFDYDVMVGGQDVGISKRLDAEFTVSADSLEQAKKIVIKKIEDDSEQCVDINNISVVNAFEIKDKEVA